MIRHCVLLCLWISATTSMSAPLLPSLSGLVSALGGSDLLPIRAAAGAAKKPAAKKQGSPKQGAPKQGSQKKSPQKQVAKKPAARNWGGNSRGRNNRGRKTVRPKIIISKHSGVKRTLGEGAEKRLQDMETGSMTPEERAAFEQERQQLVAQQFKADLADQQRFRDQIKAMRLTKDTVNKPQQDGELLLHTAVRNKWAMAVEDLLAKGADPMIKDMGGNTAIDLAEMTGDLQLQKVLKRTFALSP